MQVPGKRQDSDILNPCCQPCAKDNKNLSAEGYCDTCGEYLCEQCFKVHTVPTPMRNHNLLDKSSMPHQSLSDEAYSKNSSLITIRCPDHKEECFKFFCQTHDSVLCGVCAFLNHRTCSVEYIPESKHAQDFKDSKEYIDLTNSLDNLEVDVSECLSNISENETTVEEKTNKALRDIRNFRKDIDTCLDKQEQVLLDAVLAMNSEDQPTLCNIADDLKLLKRKIQQSKNKLLSLENENNNLFVVSKQIIKQMMELQKLLKEAIEKNQTPHYKFKPNESITRLLSSTAGIGSIERSYRAMSLVVQDHLTSNKTSLPDLKSACTKKCPDLSVKTSNDRNATNITGLLFIEPNTLLAADFGNCVVKAVDTKTYTVKAQLSLLSYPYDIAVLPDHQVVVSVPYDKRILVVSVAVSDLSFVRSIVVSGLCHGICSTAQILVVSFIKPGKVEVMDHFGTVLENIDTDLNGKSIFEKPLYAAMTSEKVIYVSDYGTSKVTKLSITGEILSTCTHQNWKQIFGLALVGEDQLLICNCDRDTAEIMNTNESDIIPVIERSYGVVAPRSVCFSLTDGLLFIGSNTNGTPVSVFEISRK